MFDRASAAFSVAELLADLPVDADLVTVGVVLQRPDGTLVSYSRRVDTGELTVLTGEPDKVVSAIAGVVTVSRPPG